MTTDGGPVTDDALPDDDAFRAQLIAVIPHLRAFARSLSGNRDTADDLVQDTMVRAWTARASYTQGTNFKAWTFVILRNHFLSQRRRDRFHGDYDADAVEQQMAVAPAQEDSVMLADVQRALMQLPDSQREALILVGAGGFEYEEAAAICGVAVGTIKSRVSRARATLELILAEGGIALTGTRQSGPAGTIMAEVDALTTRIPPG
jgi:RNA polymerase sigma factor (sigma-70 family)